jgi:cytochrome b561
VAAIPFKDTRNAFGAVSVALHWIVAAFVLIILASALVMMIWLPDRSAPPLATPFGTIDRPFIVMFHQAMGLLLLPFAFARAAWRWISGKPAAPTQSRPFMLAAAVAWRILLIGVLLQLITGPLMMFFYGYPLQIFALELVPSPFSAHAGIHDALELFHKVVGLVVLATLVLHIGGAFRHALFSRDGTLLRMVWPGRTLRVRDAVPETKSSRALKAGSRQA